MLKTRRKIYYTDSKYIKNNKFYDFANFFNGTLIKVDAIKSIGQINKNFFLIRRRGRLFLSIEENW